MTAATKRALSRAIGALDFTSDALSRAEHGANREVVTKARERLSATASDLLRLSTLLEATGAGPTRIEVRIRGEH